MDQFDTALTGGGIWSFAANLFHGPFTTYAPIGATAYGPIKYYWEAALQGTLCDNYYTSEMGPSTPNHMFSFAAQCGNCVSNVDLTSGLFTVIDASGQQSSHPNHFTASEIPTSLANELEAKGLTWRYFAEGNGGDVVQELIETLENNSAEHQVPRRGRRAPRLQPVLRRERLEPRPEPRGPLTAGNVGNVTWIKPAPFVCEHPGLGEVDKGAEWTRQVVHAIGQSPYWNHCAILITWDDFGGFYDHVAPPQVDQLGLGFRVPCDRVEPLRQEGLRRSHAIRAQLALQVRRDRLRTARHERARRGLRGHDGRLRLHPDAARLLGVRFPELNRRASVLARLAFHEDETTDPSHSSARLVQGRPPRMLKRGLTAFSRARSRRPLRWRILVEQPVLVRGAALLVEVAEARASRLARGDPTLAPHAIDRAPRVRGRGKIDETVEVRGVERRGASSLQG